MADVKLTVYLAWAVDDGHDLFVSPLTDSFDDNLKYRRENWEYSNLQKIKIQREKSLESVGYGQNLFFDRPE